jgi:tetratricopeptide (TPR) repeat protein
MTREHLSVETMARWLAGDLEHEEVLREVVPHLLARCAGCRASHDEIRRLQREVEHWDERVAVYEGREAPALLAVLEGLPLDEQLARVRAEERFQTWGLCRLLLRSSLDAGLADPARAVDLAELAVALSELLVEEAYDPSWLEDLRARCWAHLGNAYRVLGELWSSEAAFRRAEGHLARSQTGSARVLAELLGLKASLRHDQRRLAESQELFDRALALHREEGDLHLVGRCLIGKARTLEEAGQIETAIVLLEEAERLIDRQRESRLLLCALHNRLWLLATAERGEEAADLLPAAHRLSEELGNPLDLLRLRWTEGRIALAGRRFGPAETALREVQREFFARRMGYDAALASLDLAVLYAEEGRADELKRLAAEILPVFESREVHREAMAALLLFQHAAEEDRLTVELARHLGTFLARERRPSA